MTAYSFGNIVLVPFPFTDQSTVEKSLVIKTLGRLKKEDRKSLRESFYKILGEEFKK